MAKVIPRTAFAAAVSQVAKDHNIDPDVVLEAIQSAIIAAYKKDLKEKGLEIDETNTYKATVDGSSGSVQVFCAKAEAPEDFEDVTPPGFGRIAAQTAKQVIIQKMREAERSVIISQYKEKIGGLINGMVLRYEGSNVVIDLSKTEAVMPAFEQVESEDYQPGTRMIFYVSEIREGPRGEEIVVSRAHKNLVIQLFKREVPEVNSGAVEIKAIAREPGGRTKMAVVSTQPGVDPVGSCVGQKGVRVQSVINELKGEKIDIFEWSEDIKRLVASAIAPAMAQNVIIDQDRITALVTVPDDQLSLAIGKDGQNVRLAAKLTNYKIDVIGESGIKPESARDSEPQIVLTN